MIYRQLALMLTDKCNAACRFCALRCSPRNQGLISLELARQVIDEMKAMGTFARIGLSGGEAFLYPELVKEVLDYAKAAGLPQRTVATNGFWGSWSDEKLDAVLGGMKESLTAVAFSHDAFHAEYVKTEYLWRAIKALERHGIRYTIHVADVYGEMGAGEFLARCEDLDVFYRHYKLYPLAAMGNAADLPEEIFVRTRPWEETCCNTENILSVHCDGGVYPCCCPGIFSTEFRLGSLHEMPLSEIVTKSPRMKYVNVMADPARFVKMLRYAREELGVVFPDMTVNGCELCYMVFSQPGILEKLRPWIEEEYFDLLMTRLTGGEVAQ